LHLNVAAPAAKINEARPDRDVDFEEGAAGKPLKEKLDYYRRNYRLSYVWRRTVDGFEESTRKMGFGGKKVSPAEVKRKKKAEEYERERRRRFENRE
jgi:YidC/Oxa1 family membrane protein insertase